MEQIFELIFENFFFVAIAIGGIFSLLNRKNKGQQEQQRQQPQQHRHDSQQHQQQRPEKVDWREIFKTEEFGFPKTIENQTPPAVQVEKIEKDLANTEQRLQNSVKEMKRSKVKAAEKLKLDSINKKRDGKTLNLNLDQLSGTEAMKGIVLAEILGPPRSKQQYGRNYPQRAK